MVRGRDKFQKYKKIIVMICKVYSLLPKSLLKKLLIWHRKTSGIFGIVVRYAIIKNLAISVGDNVSIHPDVYIFNAEKLLIGDNVSIHPMTYIEAYGSVTIGNDVSIAHGATIMSETHNYTDLEIPIKDQGIEGKGIVIEDNVWIGAKVSILCGNKISTGSIIGAGAVVTKDIPKNTIAAGIPAKVIKRRQ